MAASQPLDSATERATILSICALRDELLAMLPSSAGGEGFDEDRDKKTVIGIADDVSWRDYSGRMDKLALARADTTRSLYLVERREFLRRAQRLVWFAVRSLNWVGVSDADAMSIGNMGLMRAIDAFDPARAQRFATFAVPLIRQALLHSVDAFVNHTATRTDSEGRSPTAEDLYSKATGDADFGNFEARYDVANMLSAIPALERRVLSARYGLAREPETLENVAAAMALSREQVRQLEISGLDRLRALFQNIRLNSGTRGAATALTCRPGNRRAAA